jgi:hypothetical protein
MLLDHWPPGFNFNVEESFEGDRYETLAICRTLVQARSVFAVVVAEKSAGRYDPKPDAGGGPAPAEREPGALVNPSQIEVLLKWADR